jgi:inhibitor of cysteine peptidase
MRRAWLTFPLVVIVLAACAGSGATPAPPTEAPGVGETLTVDCATFEASGGVPVQRSLTVSSDEVVDVILCSNPSTGFSWGTPTFDGDPVANQTDHATLTPADAPPGTPGLERFTFLTIAPGATVIRFSYSQPWAGGTKDAWRLELSMTVG